jgi:uncharacterized hydrophobic protein (TIGR00271 family)
MDESNEKEIETGSKNIRKNARNTFKSIKVFLVELLDFRNDTDYETTINSIKADIPFKGATAWILIFAVFVASIGLNANSTAVVIGAMLISPLMGPILGIGLSLAINDINTLRKSLTHLAIMIFLGLITSFLFFYLFPLSEDNSELLGRVRPDIRDVLIAFFGGLALMVARTKKGTVASVIFGVAIATALMPPLCTAGYGLAVWKLEYFLGAMYLFTINTIFIFLATFLVLKLLHFPMLVYADSVRRSRIAKIAYSIAILAMIPAIFTFITVFKENKIDNQVAVYISNEIKSNSALFLIESNYDIANKVIRLNFLNEVTEATSVHLINELKNNPNYSSLKDFELEVKGNKASSYELISSVYKENREELIKSKILIDSLQHQIGKLKDGQDAEEFIKIAKDAKIQYQDIEKIGFANILLSSKDFMSLDTLPTMIITWKPGLSTQVINQKEAKLKKWIQKELGVDTLLVERETINNPQ